MRFTFDRPAELRVYGDVAILRHSTTLASGRGVWASTTFAKRDGRWQCIEAQGTLFQPARVAVPVAAEVLDAYVGNYGEAVE